MGKPTTTKNNICRQPEHQQYREQQYQQQRVIFRRLEHWFHPLLTSNSYQFHQRHTREEFLQWVMVVLVVVVVIVVAIFMVTDVRIFHLSSHHHHNSNIRNRNIKCPPKMILRTEKKINRKNKVMKQ